MSGGHTTRLHGATAPGGESLEDAVADALRATGRTVAVGESITAGGVGARLVRVPGASTWFRGGLITYATEAKALLAGLSGPVLEGSGPVSREAAEGLAVAAADRLAADIGLGVVGVAGPGPIGTAEVGTVWVAVAIGDGEVRTRGFSLPDEGRRQVQELAATAALTVLLDAVGCLGTDRG